MIRSCNKCKNFAKDLRYCKEYGININDTTSATYCKSYYAKDSTKKNVRCSTCKNMNRYNYCNVKKRCFNEDERFKIRQCINFIFRKPKKKSKS